MKSGFRVFLAVLVALGLSWCGFVLAPALQLGTAKQTSVLNSTDVYPVQRTGAANLGLQVYRANGCAACHTEQIRQTGMVCDVVLTGLGKNSRAIGNVLGEISPAFAQLATNDLPKAILSGVSKETADSASDKIAAAGGKVEIHIVATGEDISRGWGVRRSVAEDYLWDYPVQLGALRVGPDLADVGARLENMNWQLQHLYAPRSVVEKSVMPPFRYLFVKQKIGDAPSPDALQLPKEFAPPSGYEIVPTDDAKNLAAYLLSLHADMPLHDAPFTPAAAPAEKEKSMSDDLKNSPEQQTEGSGEQATVPIWIFALTLLLIFTGGVYFDRHSGWFDAQVYSPYDNAVQVELYQPKSGEAAMLARGKQLYEQNCGTCHSPDGMGKPGQAPPLAGSEWVNAKTSKRVATIPLEGLTGQIHVAGQTWNASMAAMGAGLSDSDLAGVLTYIRTSWGNKGEAVTPEDVKAVRAAIAGHPAINGEQGLNAISE